MKNHNYRLGSKLFISILVLFLLLNKINIDAFSQVIINIEWIYLFFSLFIYLFAQAICALKWKILANSLGITLPLKEFIAYYFIGMFFNLFLPTSIGGDISKCYYLVKRKHKWSHTIVSILGERLAGAISMAMILVIGTVFLRNHSISIKAIAAIKTVILSISFSPKFIVLILIVILTLIILKITHLLPDSRYLLSHSWINQIREHFSPVFTSLWKMPAVIFKAIGLGLVFQLLIILIHILIGYSLALTIPFLYYFIVYPIADLISFLPFSFNGIGLREWSYTYLLGLIGIPQEKAFGFSLLWFSILLLSSLLGGIVFTLGNFESPRRISMVAEAEK